ncbi:serine hydrolase domain-containing protein [Pseudoalteromonas sp. S16_S37]|uniref:serine hydrolase domain-containing protein n=1 Tax=Pseudoalteromonas sp. S16_S37 TaxID=2720228 RepID=UPI00167FFF7A|nr:serine hydrolase domain-containing protein [Pseudoalteromonas sp. S16_S37]MBD1582894.1 beta-lactamase family protein [Pseudoalteromonas sp. S16_S37]
MTLIRSALITLCFISPFVSADNDFFDNEIKTYMKANNVPALSVGVIENGKVTFKHGYGVYNRNSDQAIKDDSLFQIGSQTKVLTSIITLALIDEGRLSHTSNIAELLPEHFQAIDKNVLKNITIDTLLSHRSGLPNYPSNVTRVDGDAMKGGYSEAQLFTALKTVELAHQPNSKFAYSNFNYALLGYIASKVSGKTYAQLVKHYINDGFAVNDVYVQLSPQLQKRLVTPYRKDQRDIATSAWNMGLLTPHGGAYASIDGMLELMKKQLIAYNNHSEDKPTSPLFSSQADYATGLYDGLNYGYGMFSATPELGLYPQTVYWHGGDLDGFGSEYVFAPQSNSGVVLLTSSGGKEFVMLGRKLMRHLLAKGSE